MKELRERLLFSQNREKIVCPGATTRPEKSYLFNTSEESVVLILLSKMTKTCISYPNISSLHDDSSNKCCVHRVELAGEYGKGWDWGVLVFWGTVEAYKSIWWISERYSRSAWGNISGRRLSRCLRRTSLSTVKTTWVQLTVVEKGYEIRFTAAELTSEISYYFRLKDANYSKTFRNFWISGIHLIYYSKVWI